MRLLLWSLVLLPLATAQSCKNCGKGNVAARRIKMINKSTFTRVAGVEITQIKEITPQENMTVCAQRCDSNIDCLVFEYVKPHALCVLGTEYATIEQDHLTYDTAIFIKINGTFRKKLPKASESCISGDEYSDYIITNATEFLKNQTNRTQAANNTLPANFTTQFGTETAAATTRPEATSVPSQKIPTVSQEVPKTSQTIQQHHTTLISSETSPLTMTPWGSKITPRPTSSPVYLTSLSTKLSSWFASTFTSTEGSLKDNEPTEVETSLEPSTLSPSEERTTIDSTEESSPSEDKTDWASVEATHSGPASSSSSELTGDTSVPDWVTTDSTHVNEESTTPIVATSQDVPVTSAETITGNPGSTVTELGTEGTQQQQTDPSAVKDIPETTDSFTTFAAPTQSETNGGTSSQLDTLGTTPTSSDFLGTPLGQGVICSPNQCSCPRGKEMRIDYPSTYVTAVGVRFDNGKWFAKGESPTNNNVLLSLTAPSSIKCLDSIREYGKPSCAAPVVFGGRFTKEGSCDEGTFKRGKDSAGVFCVDPNVRICTEDGFRCLGNPFDLAVINC